VLTSYEKRLTKHLYEIFSLGVQLYDCLLETMVAEAAFCYATIQKINMVKYSYRNKGMVILMEFIMVALLSVCCLSWHPFVLSFMSFIFCILISHSCMKQLQLHANYTFLLYETVLASCKLQLPCHPLLKFSIYSHFENDMTSLSHLKKKDMTSLR